MPLISSFTMLRSQKVPLVFRVHAQRVLSCPPRPMLPHNRTVSIPRLPLGLPRLQYFHNSPRWQRGRSQYTYSRFGDKRRQSFLLRWSQRPTFYREVGGLAAGVGAFYVWNLETVPISGRRRFNVFGSDFEKNVGGGDASEVLQMYGGKVLSVYDRRTIQVRRVLDRLIPACGLSDLAWELYVVDNDDLVNAMVLPGGKVFVFTGIMKYTQDDDGMAAVLGHEISHVVARHAAEKMSRNIFFIVAALLVDYTTGTAGLARSFMNLLLEWPNSRVQEREADYMGLMLMAQSCYEPKGALELWQRMEKANKMAPPEFFSTHPSDKNRVELLRGWLSEAEEKRSTSNCASTLGYAQEFRQAFPQARW